MRKGILILMVITLAFVVACTKTEPVACTMDAKVCPDGSAVGRVGPDCEFAPCPSVEEKPSTGKLAVTPCTEEQRNVPGCTKEYMPVCGWFGQNIKCIRYPCASVYSNKCEACQNPNVDYYSEGSCPSEEDGKVI